MLNPGISEHALDTALSSLGQDFPKDYQEFLRSSNGGHGFIGQFFVSLWKADDLERLNAAYEVTCVAPHLFLFGSDGGGEAFAFDTREDPWAVVQVPFIGMGDPENAIPTGGSFTEFLENLVAGHHPWTENSK